MSAAWARYATTLDVEQERAEIIAGMKTNTTSSLGRPECAPEHPD